MERGTIAGGRSVFSLMKNIAITGISGYIGTRLLSHLDGIDSVQKIK